MLIMNSETFPVFIGKIFKNCFSLIFLFFGDFSLLTSTNIDMQDTTFRASIDAVVVIKKALKIKSPAKSGRPCLPFGDPNYPPEMQIVFA